MATTNISALPYEAILTGSSYQYRIIRAIGSGTFGITYLAEMYDPEGNFTGMYAAVKELYMSDFSERMGNKVVIKSHHNVFRNYYRRFRAEAENLSRIRHDNIVKVYECFECNSTIYYSMSYIEGGTLDDFIQSNGCLVEKDALPLVRDLAMALGHLHNSGMLHLDIKPSNIMLLNQEIPVLIDFGLAKHFGGNENTDNASFTSLGTQGYAPVEQGAYQSDSNRIPYTIDVYALGATLFKMLTGKRPPDANDVASYGLPLSELREKNVSEAVIKLIVGAMAPSYTQRYPLMADLISDIDDILLCAAEGGHPRILGDNRNPGERFCRVAEVVYADPGKPSNGFDTDNGIHRSPDGSSYQEEYVSGNGPSPQMFNTVNFKPRQVIEAMPEINPYTETYAKMGRKKNIYIWSCVATFSILIAVASYGYSIGFFDSKPKGSVEQMDDDAILTDDGEAVSVEAPAEETPKSSPTTTQSAKNTEVGNNQVKEKRVVEADSTAAEKWSNNVKIPQSKAAGLNEAAGANHQNSSRK